MHICFSDYGAFASFPKAESYSSHCNCMGKSNQYLKKSPFVFHKNSKNNMRAFLGKLSLQTPSRISNTKSSHVHLEIPLSHTFIRTRLAVLKLSQK